MARDPSIVPEFRVCSIRPYECLVAYRTVHVASMDDPALRDSFLSHHAEGVGPRYEQTQHTALHHAVSLWRNPQINRTLAQRYPDHGDYIACVNLTYGYGFNYMHPEAERNPAHLRVWGDPDLLAGAVVDIFSV